ncbi:helix-turn-helix transcriptional regulator [Sphingomonas cavernae]|nr:helix-turn-helix transcriptional regulator [Sphingomonas cavernae]
MGGRSPIMFGNYDAPALRAAALEAAVDDARWTGLVEPLLGHFGAVGAVLGVVDRRSGEMIHAGMIGFDADIESVWREYVDEMGVGDTQVRVVMTSSGSRSFADGDHVDMDNPGDAGYLRWQEARLGSRHHLSFAEDVSEHITVGLSWHRARSTGHAEAADRARIAALQQILAPALRLGFTHAEALTDSYWEGALSRRGERAAMLDERGRVIRLTPSFEDQIRKGDPLLVSGGRIRAAAPDRDHMLCQFVAEAVSQRSRQPGAVALTCTDGRRMVLNIFPLSFEQRFLAGYHAAALVFLVDADHKPADGALLQRTFGLTGREALISTRLASGHDLAEIAAELAISRETARVHLRNIFAKTRTNRQSALVRLISLVGG